MKKFILVSALLSLWSGQLFAQLSLFPTPTKQIVQRGEFLIGKDIRISGNGGYAGRIAKDAKTTISTLSLADSKSSGQIEFLLKPEEKLPEEGYRLSVTTDKITVLASTEQGLFYGKESLVQLVRFGKGTVRACRIEDAPRYQWRGFMLDESRHFFGKEKVKQYLDIMASLKLNIFHWHLTDEPGWRIEIKRYPKLTTTGSIGSWHDPEAPATFYTQEEIKEIVAYAAERHITIIPEFDMPGHATAVCRAYPEVSGGGEGKWEHFTFHPCKNETYEFISNILDEIVELFPSPYIHIGGDEVHYGNQSWFTDPDIQAFIKEKSLVNETGLEHYFIRRATDIVASKGKK